MPDINMPRLSDTMQEGTITRWLKKPGDEVKKGEVVAEVETDKANMEIESFNTGTLEQILVKEGETAPIGQPIAVIGSGASSSQGQVVGTTSSRAGTANAPTGQAVASNSASNSSSGTANTVQQTHVSSSSTGTNGRTNRENGFIKVSPLARRIAEEHNIELSQVQGTGPGGRIVRDDIEDYIEQHAATGSANASAPAETRAATSTSASDTSLGAQAEPVSSAPSATTAIAPETSVADVDVVTLSSMQRTIARRLTESKQTIPHFYVGTEIDMTDVLAMRQQLNAHLDEDGGKISVNDLIIKACALALEKFPQVNASYGEGQFVLHKQINIGIAVDIPNGLVVPVIRDADKKGVRTIAREARALITKAQAGKLSSTDLEGGTFSISNLGMMDVTEFSAVINPPHAAILAVASTRKTFVPIDNQPVVRDMMHVTLSADHRVIYGAMVARFLQEVKRVLQNVYPLLG